MNTYVINVITKNKKFSYMTEAKNLLRAKEIVQNKFKEEHPKMKIIKFQLGNPTADRLQEVLDLFLNTGKFYY